MPENKFADPDAIRAAFSEAMSAMYRAEVPAYGILLDMVAETNAATLRRDENLRTRLERSEGLARISGERHGAIRLGTAQELSTMRRLFAVMGMFPVDYYDLTVAGIPVHSTAFRPLDGAALAKNPFRVFTSLVRLDLIENADLRARAEEVLAARRIFSDRALALVEQVESTGGLAENDVAIFVAEALKTFRWHSEAHVPAPLYEALHDAHRLLADVVSFKGPHINHLTPRTLDIDRVQAMMPARGIAPKAVVEGPPRRNCPLLLRQTSFKALEEAITFSDGVEGAHTARFGEIEQRGAALTPKGRTLYDDLLAKARATVPPAADGSNADAYIAALEDAFAGFPDDWDAMRNQGLAYFHYALTDKGRAAPANQNTDLDALIDTGYVDYTPIIYEDFLPVSAAGIFQSNLGDGAAQTIAVSSNQTLFEAQLGAKVADSFALYETMQRQSIANCRAIC